MKYDDIDRVLADESTATPSSEFLASVMSAIERDAASLPPLEFPWLRVLPGFLATIVAIVAAIWHAMGILSDPAAVAAIQEQLMQVAVVSSRLGLHWVVLAVAITIVATALSWNSVRGGGYA